MTKVVDRPPAGHEESRVGRWRHPMRAVRLLVRPQNTPHGLNGWIDAQLMPRGHETLFVKAAGLLDLQVDDDLLEVACGVGALLQRHATQARYVAGLDHSEMQVGFARKRLADRIAAGTAAVVLGDAAALPFEDGRFSAVVCLNGLELMPDPALALAEMRRVLRPGGRAVFTMGLRFTRDKAQAKYEELGFWTPTEAQLEGVLHAAGFTDPAISYMGLEGAPAVVKVVEGWFSRFLVGSDETRLVRAAAAAS